MIDSSLADCRAVVTGASRGIGRAIANALAAAGARVIGCGRSHPPQLALPETGQVGSARLDVADPSAVESLFDRIDNEWGRLDLLVANAGIGVFAPIDELSQDDFRRVVEVNLIGAFTCARAAFTLMKRRGGGRIIAIGSVADHVPLGGCTAYAASKYGLRGLFHAITEDGKDHGVLASVVSPGAVATDIWKDRPGFDPSEMLEPEDVARTVVDIASRPARVRIDEVRLMPRRGLL